MRIGSGDFGNSDNSSLTGQSNNSRSDEAQIRAIMAIWLDYIRLTDSLPTTPKTTSPEKIS